MCNEMNCVILHGIIEIVPMIFAYQFFGKRSTNQRGRKPSAWAAREDGQDAHPHRACADAGVSTHQASRRVRAAFFGYFLSPKKESNGFYVTVCNESIEDGEVKQRVRKSFNRPIRSDV